MRNLPYELVNRISSINSIYAYKPQRLKPQRK